MTLPEVCPLDENQKCKGRECHLFCLEWRTREPTCLIGYNTTSKVKSWKADRKQDTYAEDTFRKLGRQPASKGKNVSEKGDWIPTRLTKKSPEKPVQKKEEKLIKNPVSHKSVVRDPSLKYETDHNRRLKDRYDESEAEKASLRLEARLNKEQAEEKPIIYAKTQPTVKGKPRMPEKIVSSNKHTTIFESSDLDKNKDPSMPDRNEKIKKIPENEEKRRKLDEIMEIDTPEVYDEEFWS